MEDKRIGFYCWAGENTIDMIKLKYFDARVNIKSLLNSYDLERIKQAKEKFGITDMWVSFYWGFSEQKEKRAHEFILDKLKDIQALGIRVHAYIQGSNLVYDDFKDENFWAKDGAGKLIPYYRGRKVTCVNNPEFQNFHQKRVEYVSKLGFDGIYVDNIQMGQMTVSYKNKPLTFCGCTCKFCNNLFKEETQYNVPLKPYLIPEDLQRAYLDFRANSVTKWLKRCKEVIGKNVELGSNFYSPNLNTKIVYGIDEVALSTIQDYVLYEHHNFPQKNQVEVLDISSEVVKNAKYIFSLPYKRNIGLDSEYTQEDFNELFSLYSKLPYSLAIKGSEFVTEHTWHNLDISKYQKPKQNIEIEQNATYRREDAKILIFLNAIPSIFREFLYRKLLYLTMESKIFRPLMNFSYRYIIR